ncbi:MAG: HipA domain-containing protein, partial [Pyrinomonadaceae bacterium]|nr:HipA domain-containing protein [Phycisphaerales bacterium]
MTHDVDSGFFGDLPYFLHDLRPSGFLGRLIPRRHPELGLPENIQLWTSNQCLSYITRYGWNLPGNFIVGDEAFRLYIENAKSGGKSTRLEDRPTYYANMADNVLTAGEPGSSAAGEQPKFIASREPGPIEVLVKFSPPLINSVAQRIADLLVAEHIAHRTIAAHGHSSVPSEIIASHNRLFLEMERFDRTPGGGRRGIMSLFPIDAEFVGSLRSWTDTARTLLAQQRISDPVYDEISWREFFGHLIANTDMHSGNLSFFTRGTRLLEVAPSYDMLPMLYA